MPENKNMYESLRLSAGGGLNSSMEKVDQAAKTATIAIGLGGTGLSALRMFKKTVYERVKQDNYDKRDIEKPQYKRIRFLEIDSDDTKISSPLIQYDLSDEFFYIGVSDIIAELKDKAALNSKKHLEWMNKNIEMDDASAGAGGIRQVGKYLLSKKASELYNKFRDMIMSSVTGLGSDFDINIYIMAGIGGGTGSGCYVDVCYLMQQALSDLGYAGSANVLGFFFLPDVNLSNPDFPKGGPHEKMVQKNGYAALKELDYLMDIPKNGDVYEQEYSESFGVYQEVAPVKLCHLLSTTAINGMVVEDGYNYIMNVVAEYALNFVVKAEEADQQGKTSGITLKGIIPNIKGLLDNTYKKYGANYVYNILGTSCATVPYRKIGTYLAIKFFESIDYIKSARPNREDVEKFCLGIGLQFQKLDNAVKSGMPPFVLEAGRFDTKALKSVAVGEISKPLSEYCERFRTACANRRTANIATLGRRLDSYNVVESPESVIGKIFKELVSFVKNPDFGPHYAAYMIHDAQNHTLASELAGIREEVKKRRDHAQGQNTYKFEHLNRAQAEFRSATVDLFDSKKKAYVLAVEQYYRNMVEVETYEDFLNLIDKIKKQLDQLEVDYFKKYSGIVDKLLTTFKDNASYFATHGMGKEMYTWSVVDIESISGQLDEVIKKYIIRNDDDCATAPYFVERFNTMMLNNQDKWIDESEIKIAEMVSDFIRSEFNAVMSKSMKQYLQEKYNREGADLISCISTNVIKEGLVDNGVPVFHLDATCGIQDKDKHAEYIVLSIPDNEKDFEAAALQCRSSYNLQMGIAKTVLTDRIYMLEFFSGIPMYAYKDLMAYEKVYYENKSAGMHMYESEEKDWSNLPSPIPATFISSYYVNPEKSIIDDCIGLYDRALEDSIIVEYPSSKIAKIRRTPDLDLSGILREGWDANTLIANATSEELKEFAAGYHARFENCAELNASQEYDSSIRDNFARKPKLIEIVRNEVAKIDKLKNIIKDVENSVESIGQDNKIKADFIRAVLHSVIVRNRANYKFDYEERGQEETIILTVENEEYEGIPLYRAFVSFKNLNDEMREQIKEKAKRISQDITDEIYNNVVSFQEFYKDVYKEYKNEATSGKFTKEIEEDILDLLDQMFDSIDRFIINNK